jgi:subtilisin family serine protease
VSLSLGFYHEHDQFEIGRSPILDAVLKLTDSGVLVVAAAGNDATLRPFWPAALAARPDLTNNRLASVGALNPSGSRAAFSNGESWVTHWRSGAGLVSTMPITGQGAWQPDIVVPGSNGSALPPREALDVDSYSGGFATWSGSSFAAPVLAAQLANVLIECAEKYRLDQLGTLETQTRADNAMSRLKDVDDDAPE